MHLPGRPVANFDPEGLIFAAGISSDTIKLYDLRSFEKVRGIELRKKNNFSIQKVHFKYLLRDRFQILK